MYELSADNVAEYLRSSGRAGCDEGIVARELAGGVSNLVLLVELAARGERFVVKQSRGRLRVAEEWLCPVERIWREVEVLRLCGELVGDGNGGRSEDPHPNPLPEGEGTVFSRRTIDSRRAIEGTSRAAACVPAVLWEDRENFVYAMTAAPGNHRTWKEMLLAGEMEVSRELAVACGRLLAAIHAGSWKDRAVAEQFDDRAFFEQLRIEPYYWWIVKRHPDLAAEIEWLIDESLATHRRCLVHGDFSPKNLLVWPGHVMLIDFEVGHFGDPAFDLGFFLTHLLLKSVWAAEQGGEYRQVADLFWRTYREVMLQSVDEEEMAELEQRMVLNLAGCMLARVDGKSPVDYLETSQQELVRDASRTWLRRPPSSWKVALTEFR